MEIKPTASEVLGAFQLGVIDVNEARELFGFGPVAKEETKTEGNE